MRPSRPATLGVLLAALLLTPVMAGASTVRAVKLDPETDLRKLTQQANQLNKDYRGQVQSLEDARVKARKATDTAKRLKSALAGAQTDVRRFAQNNYMYGALDGGGLLAFQGDASSPSTRPPPCPTSPPRAPPSSSASRS
nr:hypothetical protein GCM10020093_055030 [Planobispora longispora]